MKLTDDDTVRAIKMSQVLQDFFDHNSGTKVLRLASAYDELVKKGLVEKNAYNGTRKFWDFLIKLDNCQALNLIPQLRMERLSNNNWYFESTPGKVIKARNLKPLGKVGWKPSFDVDLIKESVAKIEGLQEEDLTDIQIQVRKTYPRAYDRWRSKEDETLIVVVKEIKDPLELGRIFGRQPSAIQRRLKERHGIEI